MDDLMPICVQYNILTNTGYEETYEIETEVSVSELTHISSMVNDHFDAMAEYLNEVGEP